MPTFFVQFNDLGEYERALGKNYPKAAKRGLVQAARSATVIYRTETMQAPPASPNGGRGAVATGRFAGGWKVKPTASPFVVHAYNDAPHAKFVEYGRRPGKPPPVSVIAAWVRIKLRVGPAVNSKTGRPTKRGERDPDAGIRGLAFVIARAIGRRGLRGRFIRERTMPSVRHQATMALLNAFDEVMTEARHAR